MRTRSEKIIRLAEGGFGWLGADVSFTLYSGQFGLYPGVQQVAMSGPCGLFQAASRMLVHSAAADTQFIRP